MRKSNAFTLLNLMTSLSLVTVLGLTVFYTVNRIHLYMIREKIACYHIIRNTLMLDVLRRDIEKSSCRAETKNLSDNSIKTLTLSRNNLPQTKRVTWLPTQGGFYRITQTLDTVLNQWTKKRTTFFESTIKEIRLQPLIKEGIIKAVNLEVKTNTGASQIFYITLLNQVKSL